MTNEQKYSAVLKELGEVLESKNVTIACQKWEIEELKEKLAAAQQECEFAKEKLAEANDAIDVLLDEVARLKGGAA